MRSGQKKFPTHLLRSQQWHLLALVVLLALTGWYVRHDPAVLRGALWISGLLLSSRAALLAALFSHLCTRIHCFFTERPDMKVIYGK